MNVNAMTTPQSDLKPWYWQLWPWLLIALPGSVVVASIITLFIAIDSADDIVADDYYKQGLAINRTLAADERAQTLQLRAELGIDAKTQALSLTLQGQLHPTPQQLRAVFAHPVNADEDFTVFLDTIAPQHYRAALTRALRGRWTVEITDPATPGWRLRREIALPATAPMQPLAFDITP
jgi:hypothetical protein